MGTGGRASLACSDQLVARVQKFHLTCLDSGLSAGQVCCQPISMLHCAQMRVVDGTLLGVAAVSLTDVPKGEL